MTTRTASTGGAAGEGQEASPERIATLADALVGRMTDASAQITKINDRTRLLSLNAQIEAARAGGATGAAFGVVAGAIKGLSDQTSQVAAGLTNEMVAAGQSLRQISRSLATNVRGLRLSDLALTNIDLIDRNLYERSCDVRWWATDASPVAALTEHTDEARRHCARRLGVILDSYTVYYDLVLCDMEGTVVANGRPDQYRSVGQSCGDEEWFRSALATQSGEEFGFQSVHECALVGGQRALVYSCAVREGGDTRGRPLGALGIVFNWDALAQTIVADTPLGADEKARTRVCIVDQSGRTLADTQRRPLQDTLPLAQWPQATQPGKGFLLTAVEGRPCCIGHAASPGYETCATGWHSLLIQELQELAEQA